MYKKDSSDITSLGGKTVPAISTLNFILKIIEATIENSNDNEIEEPVSPPACDPEEGPPLICFQSIEEIAREVVDENRAFSNVYIEENKNASQSNLSDAENISRNKRIGDLTKSTDEFPFLIPATVSEIAEDLQACPHKPPPTLHMSGGMVSTDMTLHMASVPTSVITSTTFKHSLAHSAAKDGIGAGRAVVEDKLEQEGGINSIFQYFTLLQGDGVKNAIEPDKETAKMNNESFHLTSTDPSLVCSNHPVDLSVARRSAGRGKRGEGVSLRVRGKRKRKELPDEGQMICVAKKSFDGSRTKSNEEKKSFDILQKEKEPNQVIQDQLVSKRSDLLTVSQGANQSAIESDNLTEKLEVTKENAQPKFSKMDDIDCRLFLPEEKKDKARIVFASGLYVEIDREVFRNFEQQILGEKSEHQKIQSKSARNIASRSIQRKKVISRKRPEKQSSIVPRPIQDKTDSEGKQNMKPIEEKCDKMPKDMPMIVTSDCLDDEKNKTSEQLKVADNQLKTIQSLKNCKTPLPSPTSPPSPPGLHKLPSIVSKPSYYAKYESKKLCKVK